MIKSREFLKNLFSSLVAGIKFYIVGTIYSNNALSALLWGVTSWSPQHENLTVHDI